MLSETPLSVVVNPIWRTRRVYFSIDNAKGSCLYMDRSHLLLLYHTNIIDILWRSYLRSYFNQIPQISVIFNHIIQQIISSHDTLLGGTPTVRNS